MKRLKLSFLLILLSVCAVFGQQAKYVFYFIGDGMGVNQVQGTELYRGELEGKVGISPLLFPEFPYATVATTFSATNRVTDSAAAGTALATGHKTKNGAIGVLKDLTTQVTSVAVWAQKSGKKVGVTTSVSIDHATPAAFYAHDGSRGNAYNIGKHVVSTGFDFYAGSDFVDPNNKKDKSGNSVNLYSYVEKEGYTIARGYKDYQKKAKDANKMILFQTETASKKDINAIPYAIDRSQDDLTLCEITRSAIDFLSKDNDKGFFLMVEGGKIDWACHGNDAATAFHEVIDFDNAIRIAYEFYKQHPDETLIVVTADHETGGLSLGSGHYDLNLKVLQNQKVSMGKFTSIINDTRKKNGGKLSWEQVQELLKENFGFWKNVELSDKQEARLKEVYEKSCKGTAEKKASEYQLDDAISATAKDIINEMALIKWGSGGHSAGYVPVFAIGAGADNFQGRLDNTEIPVKIAKAAGYTVE